MTNPPSRPPSATWRKLSVSAAMLVGGRAVTSLCGLLQVPLALRHLDHDAFGAWMACTGLLWSLGTLDLGLGFAVQNRMARLIALDRADEAAALRRWTQRWFLRLAAGLLVVAPAAAYGGDWAGWFGITDPALAVQLPAAVLVVLGAVAVHLPLSIYHREAAALQMTWQTGLWTGVASVVTLAGVAAAAQLRAPLAAYAAASALLLVGPALATGIALRRHRTTPANAIALAGLRSESALFFLPQLGAAFIGSFVPTLVALLAGPTAAATYSVLQRLYGFALQMLTLTLTPLWPAYSAAAARKAYDEARRTFWRTFWLAIGLFALPTLALTPLAPDALRLWLGTEAPPLPPALLWLIAGWTALQMAGQPLAMLLNGLGRIAAMTYAGLAGLGLTLALAHWWGPQWGAAGIVGALIVPYAAINLPLVGWQVSRALRGLPPSAR